MLKKILCVALALLMIFGATFTVGCGNKEFTVTFDANGGEFVEADKDLRVQTVSDASKIHIPTVKRPGYSFDGWDQIVSKITKDTTVKARWSPRPNFTITFHGNGGLWTEGVEIQKVTNASELKPPVYKRDGYTLTWNVDLSTLVDDAHVYATWIPNTYKISFVSGEHENWGEFDLTSTIDVTYESQISGLPTPTYLDETDPENPVEKNIVGWAIVDGTYEGKVIHNSSTWTFLEDVKIRPIWAGKDEYVISYDLDGGSFEGAITSFKATDLSFPLNAPTRTGYEFVGWTGEEYATPTKAVIIVPSEVQNDLTFKAHWKAKTYTIQLDAGDAQLDADKTKIVVTYGQPIGELPIPEKEGLHFEGWVYDSYFFNGGTNEALWQIDEAITLKAKYTETIKIRFILNYSYTERWTNKDGTSGSKKHNIKFTCNGERTIPETYILSNKPLYTIYDSFIMGVVPSSVTNKVEYRFTHWAYRINGKDVQITDQTLARKTMAQDGYITLVAVGRSLFYGPY